jgi:meso-butanediol dehydrogenase/(S,S)-butanediol dehydrogenase/diacetyl reductase
VGRGGRWAAVIGGRLDGKVAVITGTGGGQGRAAALLFSAEGATVVGCDLKADGAEQTAAMVRAAGGTMTSTHPLDLGDPAAVRGWIGEAATVHGGIDILYNNASAQRFTPVDAMTDEEWHFTVRNELDLVFYACRTAWPHLAARGTSAIINTASVQGINALAGASGGFAHAATKHGLIGMTRELAAEGGPVGIRVNAISPGFILTPVTEWLTSVPGAIDGFLDHQIIKRPGQAEDIAQAALFLASDAAAFITGENLVVDGGLTIT